MGCGSAKISHGAGSSSSHHPDHAFSDPEPGPSRRKRSSKSSSKKSKSGSGSSSGARRISFGVSRSSGNLQQYQHRQHQLQHQHALSYPDQDFSTATSINGTSKIKVTLSKDGTFLEVETETIEPEAGVAPKGGREATGRIQDLSDEAQACTSSGQTQQCSDIQIHRAFLSEDTPKDGNISDGCCCCCCNVTPISLHPPNEDSMVESEKGGMFRAQNPLSKSVLKYDAGTCRGKGKMKKSFSHHGVLSTKTEEPLPGDGAVEADYALWGGSDQLPGIRLKGCGDNCRCGFGMSCTRKMEKQEKDLQPIENNQLGKKGTPLKGLPNGYPDSGTLDEGLGDDQPVTMCIRCEEGDHDQCLRVILGADQSLGAVRLDQYGKHCCLGSTCRQQHRPPVPPRRPPGSSNGTQILHRESHNGTATDFSPSLPNACGYTRSISAPQSAGTQNAQSAKCNQKGRSNSSLKMKRVASAYEFCNYNRDSSCDGAVNGVTVHASTVPRTDNSGAVGRGNTKYQTNTVIPELRRWNSDTNASSRPLSIKSSTSWLRRKRQQTRPASAGKDTRPDVTYDVTKQKASDAGKPLRPRRQVSAPEVTSLQDRVLSSDPEEAYDILDPFQTDIHVHVDFYNGKFDLICTNPKSVFISLPFPCAVMCIEHCLQCIYLNNFKAT